MAAEPKRAPRPKPGNTQPASADRRVSAPVEDYLKAIYDLAGRSGTASTNEVAERLGVAPASVTGMLRRLSSQDLIEYERYKGVRLSASGRVVALRTIRRHRVIESYLTEVLGYPWDRVHDEAERLEHAASDELVERMAAALGNPTADPHGAPIPTIDGHVDERRHLTLAELPVGTKARMVRVSDKNPGLLRYLKEIDLTPGASVEVLARAPFEGPLTLQVSGAESVVGPGLAEQVLVEEVREPS
jgi:DtxR family transcriptional regulator, Mn-dependent transcriptional regulator